MRTLYTNSCVWLFSLTTVTCLTATAASLNVSHLRCEGLDAPQLVGTSAPRFSWRLKSSERGVRQTAYQLRVTELGANSKALGAPRASARIESDQTQWVELAGFVAKPKARYQWQVRVWDNQKHDSGWSPAVCFETSLLGGEWAADWLSDAQTVTNGAAPPVPTGHGSQSKSNRKPVCR